MSLQEEERQKRIDFLIRHYNDGAVNEFVKKYGRDLWMWGNKYWAREMDMFIKLWELKNKENNNYVVLCGKFPDNLVYKIRQDMGDLAFFEAGIDELEVRIRVVSNKEAKSVLARLFGRNPRTDVLTHGMTPKNVKGVGRSGKIKSHPSSEDYERDSGKWG